jgi:hypothetical protein
MVSKTNLINMGSLSKIHEWEMSSTRRKHAEGIIKESREALSQFECMSSDMDTHQINKLVLLLLLEIGALLTDHLGAWYLSLEG